MSKFVLLLGGILFIYLFVQSCWLIWIKQARKKGLYPQKGKATMFDVRAFLLQGEKEVAIRVYREIFNVGLSEAQKSVEELERSICENE